MRAHPPLRPRTWACGLLASLLMALAACSAGDSGASTGVEPGEGSRPGGRGEVTRSGPSPEVRQTRSPTTRIAAGTCRGGVCVHSDLAVWRSVPYTRRLPCGGERCRLRMDVYAPEGASGRPVVVLVPGGPNPPSGYDYLERGAAALADRGLVVMSVGWRQGAEWDGGFPASFADVSCSVGVARRTAARYGGRGSRVVLAGHSLGGWVAAVVALTPPGRFTPKPGQCRETAGTVQPDGLVSLAGALDEVRNQGLGPGFLEPFFGGPESAHPGRWRAADPFALAASHPGRREVPVTVVKGGRDTTVTPSAARAFHAALRAGGYRSRLVVVRRAGHDDLLTSGRAIAAVAAAAATP